LEVFYIQGLSKDKIKEILKLETLETLKFEKVKKLGVLKAESDTLGEIYLQGGSWKRTLYVDEEGKIIKRATATGSFELGTLDAGEFTLFILAVLALFFLSFFIALIGTWIIGNLFTLGAYRYRENRYILYVRIPKDREEKALRTLENIISKIIKSGGCVKFEDPKKFSDELISKSESLMGKYKLFNRGKTIISGALMFALILEGIKYLGDYFYLYTIPSDLAWLAWRYPLIIVSLIGLALLIIGEMKIRDVCSNF